MSIVVLGWPLPEGSKHLVSGYAALCYDVSVTQQYRDAPVVELEQSFIGVDVDQVGLVSELAEQLEGLITEVAALPGHEKELHEALAGQTQRLPRLDRRTFEAVRTFDVVDSYTHVIGWIMRRRDRPQRVARLNDHGRLRLRRAAVRNQSKADARSGDDRRHREGAAGMREATGAGCPHLSDPDAGGVHTFARLPNACLVVKGIEQKFAL